MRKLKDLSPEIRANIRALYREGMSRYRISSVLKVSPSAVDAICVDLRSPKRDDRGVLSRPSYKAKMGISIDAMSGVDPDWDAA